MSSTARMDRARLERFNRFWEELLQAVPDARRPARPSRGSSTRKSARRSWPMGPRAPCAPGRSCGWAARAAMRPSLPEKGRPSPGRGKRSTPGRESPCPKSRPAAGSSRAWTQAGRAGVTRASAAGYVKGRQFYSWTKAKALELALKAADRVLSRIADEVDY